ncbi:serine hydrolase domain-containing protein [Neolewinella sp.]|uniref:serine hydrolase domain-containing protein n=1 Tax=Neolewinella sp. TaxID=2993543 RepID=UPI003B52AEEF
MRRFLLLCTLLTSLMTTAQTDTLRNELQSDNLDSTQLAIVYHLAAQLPVNGEVAIAFLHDGQTDYLGARHEAGRIVTVDNHDKAFAIGSISKVFTATLLADAVERGEIELDDTVNAAYDFPFHDSITFTYGQLASHTTGLPRLPNNMPGVIMSPDNPYGAYGPEQLQAYLRDEMGVQQDGSSVYSNLGFGILAYTLTYKIAETTYGGALRERIFDPLGMTQSSNGPDSSRVELVPGYSADGTPAPYWHFTDAMAGAGAIVSTPQDMARFLTAQMDTSNRVLTLTREPVVELEGPQAVGLAWQILSPEPGRTVYWHNGAVAGYRAFTGVDVEQQRGVVVLTNALLMGPEVDRAGMQLLR